MNFEIDGQEKCPFSIYECCMSELIQQAIAHSNKYIENNLVHGVCIILWLWMCGFYSRCFVQESRIEKSIWEKPWWLSLGIVPHTVYCSSVMDRIFEIFLGRNVKLLARWTIDGFLFHFQKNCLLCAEGSLWGGTLNPVGPNSSEVGLANLAAL